VLVVSAGAALAGAIIFLPRLYDLVFSSVK